MTKKNWGLLIILLVLTGVFGILLSRKATVTSLETDEDIFAVADTASIQRIELQQPGGEVHVLKRQQRGWQLNNAYKADPQLMSLILSVLHNVEVKRPIAQSRQPEAEKALLDNGIQVRVYGQDGLLKDFYAGGNEQEQLSYFMDEGTVYVVELPGYANYISGIFGLNENNLRSRTLFTSNYLNLQEIKVEYPQSEKEDVRILYDGKRLITENIPRPDSTQLLGFLSLFENLQAVGYVDASAYPDLDSLMQQGPVAEITVKDLLNPEGKRIQIYPPAPESRYRLAYLPAEQQAVLLDERLARMLLIDREQLSGR